MPFLPLVMKNSYFDHLLADWISFAQLSSDISAKFDLFFVTLLFGVTFEALPKFLVWSVRSVSIPIKLIPLDLATLRSSCP